jgi:hypothetical protein
MLKPAPQIYNVDENEEEFSDYLEAIPLKTTPPNCVIEYINKILQ